MFVQKDWLIIWKTLFFLAWYGSGIKSWGQTEDSSQDKTSMSDVRYSQKPSLSSCDVWTSSSPRASPHFERTECQLGLKNAVKPSASTVSVWSCSGSFRLSATYLAQGSQGPPASCTESRSSSGGLFECNEPARARPAGSLLECPHHCLQKTTERERKARLRHQRRHIHTASQRWSSFGAHLPSLRIHHGWWSTPCCRC